MTVTTTPVSVKALPTRARHALGRPFGWAVLGIVLVVALVIGSYGHGQSGDTGRVAYLDSVIKCPSCDDLSIAQSTVPEATELRSLVRDWVNKGWTNAKIESEVVRIYSTAEILAPTNRLVWIIPLICLAGAAGILSIFLLRRRGRPGSDRGESDKASDDEIVAQFLAVRDEMT